MNVPPVSKNISRVSNIPQCILRAVLYTVCGHRINPQQIFTCLCHHHLRATTAAPTAAANNISAPGGAARSGTVPELLPGLVAPCLFSMPECPYDVASMDGLMETVLLTSGYVVGNVTVEEGETALSALLVRKTIAAPGAGTGIEHVLAAWSHCTVVTFSVPWRRPSDWKLLPRVCRRCPMASSATEREGNDSPRKV